MSKADDFRKYAEEAMRGAIHATSEKDKNAFIELARTWTQAALRMEGAPQSSENNKGSPPSAALE